MKKRILAAILTIAMLFSMCTMAHAELTPVDGGASFVWDFDGEEYSLGHAFLVEATYPETEGVDGSRCFYLDGNWSVTGTNRVLLQAKKGKKYEFSFDYKGALYCLYTDPYAVKTSDTEFENMLVCNGAPKQENWVSESFIINAEQDGNITLRVQSGTDGVWIDNIKIVEVADAEATPEGDGKIESNKEAKILCIGDSITHGNGLADSYFTSYRYPLWKKLIDAGVSFEMVGPREGNFNANCSFDTYQGKTFSNKHYAQYGVKLEDMKETIGTDCANTDFNVAIINLGTNDRGENVDNIPSWLAEMTNELRAINPNVSSFKFWSFIGIVGSIIFMYSLSFS